METLFLYFAKTILCSGVMFLYYKLFLKDRTFHHYNRFYLLSVLVISLLLPLLKVSYFTLEVNSDIYMIINSLQNFNSTNTINNDFIYFKLAAFVVGLVSVFFLTKLILGLIKIQLLKKKFPKENLEGISFYLTNLQDAPFSFFRNLFWKNSILINSDLGKQILKHEMVHIEQKHSWDKIFTELLTSIFWFNPFFYLIKKEICLIHEYLADKKAVKNSDTKAFAEMLLANHFPGALLPATSPFLSSNLKKRLTMLKKPKTKFSYVRRISALPILFILGFIYLVNAKNKEIKETNREISRIVSEIKKDTVVAKNATTETLEINSIAKTNEVNTVSVTENPAIPPAPPISPGIAFGIGGTEISRKNPELFVKKDTINEKEFRKLQKVIGEKNEAIQPLKELLSSKNKEARKLSDEMRKKSDEFRALSKNKDYDNPEYKKLESDMNNLGKQIDNIYNSTEFKQMESHYKEMDKLYAQLDKYYQSDEYQSKFREAEKRAKESEKMFNSPEFKKQIKDAEERAREAEKMFNAPEFKKQMKEAEERAKEAERKFGKTNPYNFDFKFDNNFNFNDNSFFNKSKLSPKEQRRLEKKQKELQEKQKDLQKKQRELQQKQKELNKEFFKDNNLVFFRNEMRFNPDSAKVYVFNKGNSDKTEIYINGKKSSNKDLQSLNPDKIARMNVFKTNGNGKIEAITK